MVLTMLLSIVPSTISFAAMGDYGGNITGAIWYWPLHGYSSTSSAYSKITSSYGYRGGSYNGYHRGVDIGASNGTAVYPTRKGTVSEIHNSTSGSYGRYVIINHNDGYFSIYMHLSRIDVSGGQSVGVNTQIGAVGGSGYNSETAYAYHLHMGIHYGNSFSFDCSVNPCPSGYTRIGNSLQESAGGYPIGSASISYSVNPEIEKPAAPTITSVSTVSTSSLKVKWNAVSGATSYRIDRRRSGDEAYSTIVSSTTSTSYTDTGLLSGEKYYYRVYALNGSVISDRSESIGAYTQCDIPEITSAVGDSTSSITIKWNYVNGASYYRIDRRKQTEDAYYTIVANHTGSRTYTDTGLVAGAKYYYRVYAVNDSSTSAKPDGYGGYTQCEIPTITSVTANSPSSITIKWNGVGGAASYRIDRRKQADDAYTTIVTGYTLKSYTDTGLEAGTKYYYRVYAVTEGSVSAKPDGEGTFTKYIYTIKYNANGGSGAPGSQSKIQDTALTLSSTKPTRTGYSFVNWNTKADGSGTAYKAGGSYTANSNATLYAYWNPWKYTIAYNLNGGEGEIFSQSKTQDVVLTLSTSKPTKTGYSFVNWNTKADGSGTTYKAGGTYTANSGATLYAQWSANSYTVTFDVNGGTTSTNSKSVIYDSTYGTLPIPTKSGFTFKGWYTSASEGTQITSSTKVSITSAQTLYAQWEEVIPYTESTVTKSGLKLIIDTKEYNFIAPYNILIVGYKRNQFVTMKRVPHDEQNSPYTLEGDIDEIKVMVWDSLSGLKPLCDTEVIPSSEFIIE